MAAVAVIESPQGLKDLFTNISSECSPAESDVVVQLLKRNYGGKFNLPENQDLLSCLQLLEKHGFVSDNKLTLLEDFVASQSNKEVQIKEMIESFKVFREQQVDSEKKLPGRQDQIKKITKKLETTKQVLAVNLFGSGGVGKTTLAKEVCSKWQGMDFFFDLREAMDMRAIYLNIMNSLGLRSVPVDFVDLDFVVTRIHDEIRKLSQPVLFLLDNADRFTAGQGKEGKNLRTVFVQFLERLSEFDEKDKKPLKLLLTSRTKLKDAKKVDNFEVKSLENSFSEEILNSKGMVNISTHQRNELINISKGIPLLLNGLAAILRQERKSVDELIAEVQKGESKKLKLEEDSKEKPFNVEEEGLDLGQFSTIREMFNSLPTDSLKVSAVSISLFCGPFLTSTAAKILGLSPSEALVQLEGLAASAVISVVDEEAKEVMYDIHPLLRKYADSIKDDEKFSSAYLEAKGRFHQHFMARMEKISKLIEPDYVKAFQLFEADRANYEVTVEISLQSEYFSVPGEFLENALIASLFNAMLTEDKQIKLFHSWAEMCEDDGRSGSLCRAQLKCWEARQVLDADGTEKAFEVIKEASCSLDNVQDKSSESYKLSKGLLLYSEGETYWRKGDYRKALETLELSLQFTEELLKVHTDLARCYNAIGNCHSRMNKPEEALEFYKKAYKMQKQLAGSDYHFDMPMYKNQMGTAYEVQRDYEKAEQCYRDALNLLEELQMSGFHDEAHFFRNLANTLMFQEKYSEAVEPADRACSIRMKLLGNHPLTVRSIFQRGVVQANLDEFKNALDLFLEAWKMEKSLGAGNHSEVWRKIITGVEHMYDDTADERKMERYLPSFFSKKEQFRRDALDFCKRFWEEEKRSAHFSFTKGNKEIIDALLYLVRDKKDKDETEKDALWFYEEMQSATMEEFQEQFDQETDTSELNEMLKERDEFLDKVIEFCLSRAEHEKLARHKAIKLALYKKVLVRPDFVGKREYAYEKATLKAMVEQLYREVGEEENIPIFQEILLRTWQTRWEEGKGGERLKEFGVARERTITGIVQLCKELEKEEMFRRYGKEALRFYENVWGLKQDTMELPEMEKFLLYAKELASSIGEYERENIYDKALQTLKETGKHPGAISGLKELEELENTDEQDPEKIKIHEGTVTNEGTDWNLKEWAVHMTFPCDAVSEPTVIEVHRWKSTVCSTQLQEHEAVVSNVIEISRSSDEALKFKARVTLALSHSAADLHGYELVIFKLTNKTTNEWEEVGGTENFLSLSDLEEKYPSAKDVRDFPFPIVQAEITECSTYAAVYRLKSSIPYIITSNGGFFNMPEYPDVCVTIPMEAVAPEAQIPLQIKVQEVPRDEFKGKEVLAGPILRISCCEVVDFLKPVTIQLPVSLRTDEQLDIPDVSKFHVRVLFLRSEDGQKEWVEITEHVKNSIRFDGKTVRFQVQRFSGYTFLLVGGTVASSIASVTGYLSSLIRCPPQLPVFIAYFPPGDRPGSQDALHLICCPSHLRENVTEELDKKSINFLSEADSQKGLIPGHDKAYVSLSGGIEALDKNAMENVYLRFECDRRIKRQVAVRVISDKELCDVKLYSSPRLEENNFVCELCLHARSSPLKGDFKKTPVEFFGVPLDDSDLTDAPLTDMLAACKGVLQEINREDIYKQHTCNTGSSDSTLVTRFFEAIARLPPEDQEKCFDTVVAFLKEGGLGLEHIADRLRNAQKLVNSSPDESLRSLIAEKVGRLWRKLASKLNVKENVMDSIEEERRDCEDCCRMALKKWRESNGSLATVRELMRCLTDMGSSDINWHIMKELNLLTVEKMQQLRDQNVFN